MPNRFEKLPENTSYTIACYLVISDLLSLSETNKSCKVEYSKQKLWSDLSNLLTLDIYEHRHLVRKKKGCKSAKFILATGDGYKGRFILKWKVMMKSRLKSIPSQITHEYESFCKLYIMDQIKDILSKSRIFNGKRDSHCVHSHVSLFFQRFIYSPSSSITLALNDDCMHHEVCEECKKVCYGIVYVCCCDEGHYTHRTKTRSPEKTFVYKGTRRNQASDISSITSPTTTDIDDIKSKNSESFFSGRSSDVSMSAEGSLTSLKCSAKATDSSLTPVTLTRPVFCSVECARVRHYRHVLLELEVPQIFSSKREYIAYCINCHAECVVHLVAAKKPCRTLFTSHLSRSAQTSASHVGSNTVVARPLHVQYIAASNRMSWKFKGAASIPDDLHEQMLSKYDFVFGCTR